MHFNKIDADLIDGKFLKFLVFVYIQLSLTDHLMMSSMNAPSTTSLWLYLHVHTYLTQYVSNFVFGCLNLF